MTPADPWVNRSIVALAALGKLALLVRYGPLPGDDSSYDVIAQAIMRDPEAFTAVAGWRDEAFPPLAVRPYGYPMLLAGARLLFAAGSGWFVALAQIALSLVLGACLYRLARLLTGSDRLAALVAIFYFVGYSVPCDQTLLSDSIFSLALNMVLLGLAGRYLKRRPPGYGLLVAMGALWGAAVTLKDAALFFTLLPLFWICLLGRGRPGRILPMAVSFCAPLAVIVALYLGWNMTRTGEPFISLTPGLNYLRPAFDIAAKGWAEPFVGGDPVSATIRAWRGGYAYSDQGGILQAVYDRAGLSDPLELQRMERAALFDVVTHVPGPYMRYVAGNLAPSSLGATLFDPISTANDYFQLYIPPYRRVVPGTGLKSLHDLAMSAQYVGLAAALASGITLVTATMAWLATLIGVPALLWREWRRAAALSRETVATALMLFAFCFIALFYALLHIETRLMLPAIPAGLLAGAGLARSLSRTVALASSKRSA